MGQIRMQFKLSEALRDDLSRQEEIARELKARFRPVVDKDEDLTAAPERPRLTGLELVAIIGIAIQVARGSKTLLKEVLEIAKTAAQGYHEIREILVGVGPKQIPLSQLTDQDIERIAAEMETESGYI
jgi:hypothetical protein